MRSQRFFTVVLALLIFSISTAIPSYGQFGRNKIQYKDHQWQILSTPHFDIHFYNGSEAFAARAGLHMEDSYKMLAEKLNVTLPWRVPVVLYGSHNDFLQTNVSLQMLSEGVQAFAEPSRKRIVLPFTGSWPAFAHTATHELAHVFTFQIVYNRMLGSAFSQNALFGLPLWLMEGVAEYLAVGWDTEADMFIRDGVIHDYLGDLRFARGYAVYKQGQSAFNYLEDVYGREKVLEFLNSLTVTRSADGALEKTIGLTTTELTEKWKKAQRKHYWPMIAEKTEAEELGRRLTNHIKDRAVYNTKPVMSPDGENVAFFTSRGGFISVYMLSTLDGSQQKKLIGGHRSAEFESLHFFTSSMSFSPDGSKLTLVAKSDGRSQLYIYDVNRNKVIKKLDPVADGLASPTWSPKGDRIIVSAVFGGQTDLMSVDVETGQFERLTNDFDDQLNPRFYPDGKRIAFSYYPNVTSDVPSDLSAASRRTLNELDFLADGTIQRGATMDIHEMNLETGATRPLIETDGDDSSPVVFDGGRKMMFTSDASGVSNLYVADLETGEYHRITDVLGGIFTPDVVDSKGRVAFSAFGKAGWDIYVSDDLEELIQKNYGSGVSSALASHANDRDEFQRQSLSGIDIPVARLVKLAQEREAAEVAEALKHSRGSRDSDVTFSVADEDSVVVAARIPLVAPVTTTETTELAQESNSKGVIEGLQKPVSGEEPATRGASVSRYKLRLAPDFIGQGGGLYFSTGFGFGLANTIALSDMLGNHRMVFSFNLFRDIADSDFLGQYFYLKKRINYGVGAYQFKNFLNSRVTSVGESFQDYQLFSERNYGVFGLVSYPFNSFDRLDLELQAFVSQREFFEQVRVDNQFVSIENAGNSTRNLIEPGLSFVHDASFFGPYGPVDGSRYSINVSRGFGVGNSGVSRSTAFVDYRKYKKLWFRNSMAFRVLGALSEGKDPRTFFLGGPTTLRGYDYLDFEGSRIALATLEYRFPLIDALIFGFPGRWGIGNLGGTLFFDAGAAWDKDDFTTFKANGSGLQLQDLKADFGIGTQFYFGFFLLNFQVAWPTDLHTVEKNQFHFFIGPTF